MEGTSTNKSAGTRVEIRKTILISAVIGVIVGLLLPLYMKNETTWFFGELFDFCSSIETIFLCVP